MISDGCEVDESRQPARLNRCGFRPSDRHRVVIYWVKVPALVVPPQGSKKSRQPPGEICLRPSSFSIHLPPFTPFAGPLCREVSTLRAAGTEAGSRWSRSWEWDIPIAHPSARSTFVPSTLLRRPDISFYRPSLAPSSGCSQRHEPIGNCWSRRELQGFVPVQAAEVMHAPFCDHAMHPHGSKRASVLFIEALRVPPLGKENQEYR